MFRKIAVQAQAASITSLPNDFRQFSSGSCPLMGIFVSMDSMIGKDFEKGLSNLKAVAEKP